MEKTKILFISRAYPPVKGGIENQNYELGKWLGKITKVKIIANKRGRKFLPFFAPYALAKTLFSLPKYDAILLGDGVLAFIAWFIKLISNKPVVCVVHGLDINYNSASLKVWYEKLLIAIYQKLWVDIFLKKIDHFIAVGNETIRVGIAHGLQKNKFTFIPNGVDTEAHLLPNATRVDLANAIGESVDGKKVLLTSGRLAKRKGAAWFIANVLPKLSKEFIYVVAGDGPDRQNILDAIAHSKEHERVFALGKVTDEIRNILFNSCDLFVQPNIKIHGDMEGFGISVIEAGACRLPVLASNMEGLKDAIKEGKNGFLVQPENPETYTTKINQLFENGSPRKIYGEQVRNFVVENYQWKHIAQIYLNEIEMTVKNLKTKKE